MRKYRLFAVAIGLIAAPAVGQFVPVGKIPASADDPKGTGEAAGEVWNLHGLNQKRSTPL
jgi:hypothetical protein